MVCQLCHNEINLGKRTFCISCGWSLDLSNISSYPTYIFDDSDFVNLAKKSSSPDERITYILRAVRSLLEDDDDCNWNRIRTLVLEVLEILEKANETK